MPPATTGKDSEIFTLPCLGQDYDTQKELRTEEFVVTKKTTRKQLHAQLEQYSLPVSGTKVVMLKTLRDFADNQNAWLSLFQPRKKRTRGVHTARNSLSTKRIAEQFGTEEQTITYQSKKSVCRVQRALDDKDRAANNDWAHAVLTVFGIGDDMNPAPRKRQRITTHTSQTIPPQDSVHSGGHNSGTPAFSLAGSGCESGNNAGVVTDPEALAVSSGLDSEVPSHEMDFLSVRMRRIEQNVLFAREDFSQRMDTLEDAISAKLSHLSDHISGRVTPATALGPVTAPSVSHMNSSTPRLLASPVSFQPVPALTPPFLQPLSTPPLQPSVPEHQEDAIPDELRAEARLGSDAFTFNRAEVPDPPAIHFSKDIDRLFREWEESTLLRVNGRFIPIKYWPEFYKKSKGVKRNAWGALRTKWDNWKFIVAERQAHPDDASFWHKFSDSSGQRLGYQKILKTLQRERMATAAQHAADARAFFGGDLNHPDACGAFRYLRTGQWLVCTEEDAIAQRWLKLLEDRPDLAATLSST